MHWHGFPPPRLTELLGHCWHTRLAPKPLTNVLLALHKQVRAFERDTLLTGQARQGLPLTRLYVLAGQGGKQMAFTPLPTQAANTGVVEGPKTRTAGSIGSGGLSSGVGASYGLGGRGSGLISGASPVTAGAKASSTMQGFSR